MTLKGSFTFITLLINSTSLNLPDCLQYSYTGTLCQIKKSVSRSHGACLWLKVLMKMKNSSFSSSNNILVNKFTSFHQVYKNLVVLNATACQLRFTFPQHHLFFLIFFAYMLLITCELHDPQSN